MQNAACGGWVHHENAGLVGLFGSLGRLLGLVGVDVSLLRLSQFGGDERDTGQASREGNESRDGEGAVKEDASRVAAAASRSVFVFFVLLLFSAGRCVLGLRGLLRALGFPSRNAPGLRTEGREGVRKGQKEGTERRNRNLEEGRKEGRKEGWKEGRKEGRNLR